MMGKWDRLKEKFPSKLTGEAPFLDAVANEKQKHAAKGLSELMEEFRSADTAKDTHEAAIKELNVVLEALSQLIVDRFDEQGLKSVKTDDGRTFYQRIDPQPSVTDRFKLDQYIETHPELDYLYAVQYQKLSGYVKELLDQGRDAELPPGVEVYLRTAISMRKS